jgi:PAS domain S-box-containing protein
MATEPHRDHRLTRPETIAKPQAHPALKGRGETLRVAIVILLAAAFSVIFSLVMQLGTELRKLQEEPVDSLQWNVTQLELDAVLLAAEVQVALAAPDADLAALRKSFDLFYNRAGTVTKGAMFRRLGLANTVAPVKARMRAFLTETARLFDGPDSGLRAALPEIAAVVGDLRQDFRVMAIRVIDVNAALQDAQRADLADILNKIGVASLLLVSLLVGLLALVLGLNRRAERRTREVERITARLEATVATSLDAVIVAGMDGRVNDFNAAAETIFGYTRDEAVGEPLSALIVPPQMRSAHEAGMQRMRETGVKHVVDSGRMEITAIRKSGEEFPVEMSIASSDGPEGMIFVAYLRDISDARQAEAALVAARDKAQAAEQTKTNFIAVMSHEMRTPLNGVIGALDILGRSGLQVSQDRFVSLARSSAEQLLRHVNDVLDISRVETGHMGVSTDRMDVPALVATLVDPMRPSAAKKALGLDVQILSEFPALWGDAFRVGQILQNFVSNAIKFTDAGSVTVEVELQGMAAGQAEVEFRVIDSGLGIAEADQERIFEDFVMVDPSHGRSVGGTGLGLAICRRVARAMGGEVGVESEIGAGSCFWLRLPLAIDLDGGQQEGTEVRSLAPKGGLRNGVGPGVKGLEILVVEDNEANRIVLEELLRHLGHRVVLANDGGAGVERARATRFDVILMDLSMPLMDGWTSASVIRMGGASQHSRILAVTAHARPDHIDHMIEAGFDGWLTKPLSAASLASALARGDTAHRVPARHRTGSVSAVGGIDAERMRELAQVMEPSTLERLFQAFDEQIEALVEAIATQTKPAERANLVQQCHACAGAAAVIGALQLRHCVADLETAYVTGDAGAIALGHKTLERIWPDIKATLAQGPALPA